MRPRLLVATSTSSLGGTERQMALLLPGLADRFDVWWCASLGDGWLARALRGRGARMALGGRSAAAGPAGLLAALARTRPDLVYLHGLRAELALRAPAAALGARVVSGIRNVDTERGAAARAADAATARFVAGYISNSQAGKSVRVWSGVSADRIAVVRNAVAPPPVERRGALRLALRRRLGIPHGAFVVASVAHARPGKGLETLARAWRLFHDAEPGAHLLAAGRGRADRGPGVHALGYLRDPSRVYAAADAFVLASEQEGLPNALLEAMAWGLPCVAASVGGVPEALREEDGGLLAPPGSAAGLARGLRQLVHEGASARDRGESLRRSALRDFTLERLVEGHVEFLGRVLGA